VGTNRGYFCGQRGPFGRGIMRVGGAFLSFLELEASGALTGRLMLTFGLSRQQKGPGFSADTSSSTRLRLHNFVKRWAVKEVHKGRVSSATLSPLNPAASRFFQHYLTLRPRAFLDGRFLV
jgi:hypothetical protein